MLQIFWQDRVKEQWWAHAHLGVYTSSNSCEDTGLLEEWVVWGLIFREVETAAEMSSSLKDALWHFHQNKKNHDVHQLLQLWNTLRYVTFTWCLFGGLSCTFQILFILHALNFYTFQTSLYFAHHCTRRTHQVNCGWVVERSASNYSRQFDPQSSPSACRNVLWQDAEPPIAPHRTKMCC